MLDISVFVLVESKKKKKMHITTNCHLLEEIENI
jgi:hypothetical protein